MSVEDVLNNQLANDILTINDKYQTNPEKLKIKLFGILAEYHIHKYNDIIHNDSNDIHTYIDLFLSAKKLEGLSSITLDNYQRELHIFSKRIHKNLSDIGSSDIRIFLAKLENVEMSTISKKLWVLKSFFSWLHKEGIITANPTANVRKPKIEDRLPKTFTIEELEMMRESCKTIRQRSMCELFYATGCRLSEIQKLNKQDINWQDNSIKVIGKGNKEREVYFSFKARYYLQKYLKSRHDFCDALFVTERNPHNRLSRRGIERELKIIGQQANLNQNICAHDFRRSFATITLNNDCDILAVQELLGHVQTETTLRYCRISETRKREQYKKHFVQ